jgi:hypothetical protein
MVTPVGIRVKREKIIKCYDIISHLRFITFDITYVLSFFIPVSDIMSHFIFIILYIISLHLFSVSNSLPFVFPSFSMLCPFDILSHSTFFLLTFCPFYVLSVDVFTLTSCGEFFVLL